MSAQKKTGTKAYISLEQRKVEALGKRERKENEPGFQSSCATGNSRAFFAQSDPLKVGHHVVVCSCLLY